MELQEYHALRATEDTHWWFRSLHELVLKSLKRRVPKGNLVILDAGCGTGGLLRKLEALGGAGGMDVSDTAVRYCRERGLKVTRADLNMCDLPSAHYDVITCVDLLYHRNIADVPAVLRKFHVSLKPGGILFLHLPAFECLRSAHDEHVHTARRFRLGEVRDLLEGAGFEIEECSYRVMLLLPFIVLKRALSTLLSKAGLRRDEGSDLRSARHGPVNAVLLMVSRLENALLRLTKLPVGVSLYAVARKIGRDP